ncbi:YggL family protein [Aliiglaciecola sp. CAU 1673]|uniref:YggL 50S ribosome-binding family protein n=1 Tax=Aliiglaciecola sp. CAU 1673 TaxID=3032595 RepID=UPI0023DBD668|nr:YggL family protein [Aliiglaciecola sp. CAU 1673]MDF2178847.1 YggL family protein [Aliiglaciecola sp. CAU 1673]
MKLDKIDNKNRRLRKKLYLGEFAVMGFEFNCQLADKEEATYEGFIDELVEFVEGRNLMVFGGGSEDTFDAFVSSQERYGSASEDDRKAMEAWLSANAKVKEAKVGDLVDANNII